jgi:hypothetical protein
VTRLGYQIPNFTYPSVSNEGIFDAIIAQAKAAESSGFDRILLMDHFHQLPGIGDLDDPILECYTTLAAIAQHTSTVRLSSLVTGNTYRNPAVLAKTVTAHLRRHRGRRRPAQPARRAERFYRLRSRRVRPIRHVGARRRQHRRRHQRCPDRGRT